MADRVPPGRNDNHQSDQAVSLLLGSARMGGAAAMESRLNPTLHRLLRLLGMDRTWDRADGAWVIDSSGRRFLDCYAQYGVLGLGHNAPVVKAAVRAALDSSEPAMVQPYRAPHAEALARVLTDLAPGDLSWGVLTTSGAEAVEAAIKIVRSRTGRPLILSATGSFHGKTMGALALTGQQQYGDGFGPTPPGFDLVEFGDADALAARLEQDGKRVAAFFVEPIQGERGVILSPPGYLARVRELCTRFGVALVLDEIQTGLGRTGRLFACEHDGVAPDVLVLGKALGGGLLPLAAVVARSELDVLGDVAIGHFTHEKNPVLAAAGLATLRVIRDEGLVERAHMLG